MNNLYFFIHQRNLNNFFNLNWYLLYHLYCLCIYLLDFFNSLLYNYLLNNNFFFNNLGHGVCDLYNFLNNLRHLYYLLYNLDNRNGLFNNPFHNIMLNFNMILYFPSVLIFNDRDTLFNYFLNFNYLWNLFDYFNNFFNYYRNFNYLFNNFLGWHDLLMNNFNFLYLLLNMIYYSLNLNNSINLYNFFFNSLNLLNFGNLSQYFDNFFSYNRNLYYFLDSVR